MLAHVVWQNFSGWCNTHIDLPQTGSSWQTKVWIPPKSSLLNQWALFAFTYRSTVSGYFQEQKCLKQAASPRPTSARVTAQKSGNLEPTQQPTSSSTGYFFQLSQLVSTLPSSSDGCCFFLAAVWSRSLLCSLTYLRGTSTFSSFSEEPRNSRQFQGLLKGGFFVCVWVFCCFVVVVLVIYLFTFLFRKLSSSTEFFNLRENYYTTAHGEDIWQNKNMQKGKNCTTAHW